MIVVDAVQGIPFRARLKFVSFAWRRLGRVNASGMIRGGHDTHESTA